MPVKEGDNVKIEYTGRLDDGAVFDSSNTHGEPLIFKAGVGMVIAGFDKAVLGMEVDEEKEFRLEPSEAYGDRDPEMVRPLPRADFPENVAPGVTMVLTMQTGQQLPLKVVNVTDDEVTVDLNHPLAGQALNFKINLLEIGCELPAPSCGCGCESCDTDEKCG